MLSKAANKVLDYNNYYSDFITSFPAKVGLFFDSRIRRPALNSVEFDDIKSEIMFLLQSDYSEDQEFLSDESPGIYSAPHTITACDQDGMIWMEASNDDTSSDNLPEVDRYAISPIADRKCDVVEWWISRQNDFPKLSEMALDYLSIPASSVQQKKKIQQVVHFMAKRLCTALH